MSLKYHRIRPLKFNFLFVVLEIIKSNQAMKVSQINPVVLAKSRHLASFKKPEGGETTVWRLCKHCGCMPNTALHKSCTCDQHAADKGQEINLVWPKIVPVSSKAR